MCIHLKKFLKEIMKIEFNEEKNKLLKRIRRVCFEDVMDAIYWWWIVDIIPNKKYPNQQNLLVKVNNYIYVCPFVENNNDYFLKTIYPSRKYNKIYNS